MQLRSCKIWTRGQDYLKQRQRMRCARGIEEGSFSLDLVGVLIGVTPELEAEADVHFHFDCEVGVSGTHSGDNLANQPYVTLNPIGLYLMFSGDNGLYTIFMCKDVEDGTGSIYEMSRGQGTL